MAVECAICFEEVAQCAGLPCRCTVAYCTRCWDRALAQSINANGRARCPTCRSPVRVDFDAETGLLQFASEAEETPDLREHKHEAIQRLLLQARPAQARILRNYGVTRPELQFLCASPRQFLLSLDMAELRRHLAALGGEEGVGGAQGPQVQSELIERLVAAAGGPQLLCAYWAQAGNPAAATPACVCGSALRRMPGKERVEGWARKFFAGRPENQTQFQRLIAQLSGFVVCDLCNNSVDVGLGVWTCDNDDSTILHATSYDVCDSCFILHTTGIAAADAPAGISAE